MCACLYYSLSGCRSKSNQMREHTPNYPNIEIRRPISTHAPPPAPRCRLKWGGGATGGVWLHRGVQMLIRWLTIDTCLCPATRSQTAPLRLAQIQVENSRDFFSYLLKYLSTSASRTFYMAQLAPAHAATYQILAGQCSLLLSADP